MWELLFKDSVTIAYVCVLCTVAIYGFHRYLLVYLYLKHKHDGYQPKSRFDELPRVTVQLPMYNEDVVAERIIKASCQIDYPKEKLEIQVLDDSTDHSAEIARKACEEMAALGHPIKYIHREHRIGYKAGALAAGLQIARGEFIAIFDADFIPPKDIFYNVVDYFTDDRIGMVQIRWDHLNRDASLLTKGQAIFLDGHFVIEHTARNRSGRFMHFNGTAGVWRRTTIDDAGGWQHDTLTEDLDLSYRAQIKGWQFVYLPQHAAPAELPPEMIGFKQQAHRWTKGSMQTCIKLLPRILRSKHLPLRVKTEAFFHLTNTIVYPLMVVLTLLMYPSFFNVYGPFKHAHWAQWLFSASLFVLATCSASTFFVFAQSELLGRQAGRKSLIYLPYLMALRCGRQPEQRQGRHRGDLERDQAQAERICPHPQIRRHRAGQNHLARRRGSFDARVGAADHRDRLRVLHVRMSADQHVVSVRPGQRAVSGNLRGRIFLCGIQFGLRSVPDEP